MTTAVASGKADIFYADTPVAGYAIKQTGDTLEALGEDVGVTPEAVAVKKGDSKTAEAVQKAIQKLMKGNSLKHPGKTYVVGKKGVFAKRGRNVKLVDRRMKVSVGCGGNG